MITKKSIPHHAITLATLFFFIFSANPSSGQVWDGSTVNTWTNDHVGLGTIPTDAHLDIRTPFVFTWPNQVSLRIYNDLCDNCAYNTPAGSSVIPNVVEVLRRVGHFDPMGEDLIYDPLDQDHPFFVISTSGKVGINTQPDELMPFKLNVEGQSYFSDKVLIGDINNNISAGVSNDFKLYVDGGILTTKVKVEVTPWPDYVFAEGYELSDLDVVATYIEENKHLPGVPSAEEVQNDGVELGEMSAVLLQKVEELTLYMIALKKENEKLKQEDEELKREIEKLKK